MATRRKSSPYTMSANLGSGVRTTTGGSYTNPRLGIEDYTAFGRGVASTFRVPEQKEGEVKQLEGGIDYFGAQKDAFLGDIEFKENRLLVDKFTNGPLAQMQVQYEKCSKANDRRCLQNISNDLSIYQTGQAQFKKYLEYADGEIMDPETSKGRFLIDVDGNQIMGPNNKPIEMSDLRKVNNESPQDMVLGIALNKNGQKKAVYQFQMDGKTYTTNLTDLNEQFLSNNFDIRSDIGLDVQTAMRSGGFTSNWEDKPTMYSSQTSETTEDGVSIKTLKGYERIVTGTGYFENANKNSKTFSNNLYKTISSPNVNSAFNNLTARIYDGSFKSDEIKNFYAANPQLKTPKDLNDFRKQVSAMPNNIKLMMLQDEAEQEWLIANASNGHRRGGEKDFDEDGNSMLNRAVKLDKKYLIKTSTATKPITEGEGGVVSSEDFYNTVNKAVKTEDGLKKLIGTTLNLGGSGNRILEVKTEFSPGFVGSSDLKGPVISIDHMGLTEGEKPPQFDLGDKDDFARLVRLTNGFGQFGKDKSGRDNIDAVVGNYDNLSQISNIE